MTEDEFMAALEVARPSMLYFAQSRLRSWPDAEDLVGQTLEELIVYFRKYPLRMDFTEKRRTPTAHFLNLLQLRIWNWFRDHRSKDLWYRYYAENKRIRVAWRPEVDPAHLASLRVDVWKALDTLDPLVVYAAWRRHVEGHHWEYVAKELDFDEATLRQWVGRELRKLQPMLRVYRGG